MAPSVYNATETTEKYNDGDQRQSKEEGEKK